MRTGPGGLALRAPWSSSALGGHDARQTARGRPSRQALTGRPCRSGRDGTPPRRAAVARSLLLVAVATGTAPSGWPVPSWLQPQARRLMPLSRAQVGKCPRQRHRRVLAGGCGRPRRRPTEVRPVELIAQLRAHWPSGGAACGVCVCTLRRLLRDEALPACDRLQRDGALLSVARAPAVEAAVAGRVSHSRRTASRGRTAFAVHERARTHAPPWGTAFPSTREGAGC